MNLLANITHIVCIITDRDTGRDNMYRDKNLSSIYLSIVRLSCYLGLLCY